jgi:hypothetical protein
MKEKWLSAALAKECHIMTVKILEFRMICFQNKKLQNMNLDGSKPNQGTETIRTMKLFMCARKAN